VRRKRRRAKHITGDEGEMTLDWVPLKRVGPFRFGEAVKGYIAEYALVLLPEEYEPGVRWSVYSAPNVDVRIYAEDGAILSVACYEECLLNGRELIGLDIATATRIIGSRPSGDVDLIEMVDGPQEVYEFEDVEGQVWVKDGRVVTVFCSGRSCSANSGQSHWSGPGRTGAPE
jgi:hypothetical protein